MNDLILLGPLSVKGTSGWSGSIATRSRPTDPGFGMNNGIDPTRLTIVPGWILLHPTWPLPNPHLGRHLSYGRCIGPCASFFAMSKGATIGEGKPEVL